MKQFRNPDTIHAPVGKYTHQIEVTGLEKLLFIAGQIGMDHEGNLPENALDQLSIALDNLLLNLEAAHMQINHVTKMTLYIVGPDMDAAARREILRSKLGDHAPTMTLVYVVALANPRIKVEVEAFATLDS
ncbi:RidA family protein [Phototrophicus methaneseepsis]|uniref:RidA family protein n=1 Tax=Phototrophicus methaneseepsis TaxID=2710758 RepID=A0A7S8E9Q9_9CHLR|nr:RidA family protein [Phototrophicus methaneseepsis]QPC82937.1 RidA family protein [Phototrophicus methaneseepsis]